MSSANALSAARQDAAQSNSTQTVAGCPTSWIEIVLEDEDGKPVPGVEYRVIAPDGSELSGVVDADGRARVEGVAPGQCRVTFPLLDRREWQGK